MPTLVLALVCASSVPAAAQPRKADKADKTDKGGGGGSDPKADAKVTKKEPRTKNFNFDGLDLNGRNRTPQLLYFLERANEELERATLEKRSFIPHMVRSVEEEQL